MTRPEKTHFLSYNPPRLNVCLPGNDEGPVADDGAFSCSPGWARTSDPSINSRMLCQLSYGGMWQRPAHEKTA